MEGKIHRRMLNRTQIQRVILNKQTSQQLVEGGADHLTPLSSGSMMTSVKGLDENKQGDPRAKSTQRGTGPLRQLMPVRKTAQTKTDTSHSSTSQDNSKPDSPTRTSTGSLSSLNVLASFAGKNRVLVISAPHNLDGYYRLMMSLLKSDVYCEMAERHMQQIVMFHQEGEMGGRVRRISSRGQVSEQPLEPALVPRLMNFLKLEDGKFGMVLLKKNLFVEERYPYPVRMEAMYEVIDQTPKRRLEKFRQRGFVQRCKAAGLEGQVVDSERTVETGSSTKGNGTIQRFPVSEGVERQAQGSSQNTKALKATTNTPSKAILKIQANTTKPTATKKHATITKLTTTTKATTTPATKRSTASARTTIADTLRSATTTITPNTTIFTTSYLQKKSHKNLVPSSTGESTPALSMNRKSLNYQLVVKPTYHPIMESHDFTEAISWNRKQYGGTTDTKYNQDASTSATQLNQEDGEDPRSDHRIGASSSKKGKVRVDSAERMKKTDKAIKKKADNKRTKVAKEEDGNIRVRKPGKKALFIKKDNGNRLAAKQPSAMEPLTSFFSYFERRRRLLVITAPGEENRMYIQQRDEYLEQVCEMALRKISIVVIFGTWNNGTMKIDHYQLEQDPSLKGVPKEDLTNQTLIKALRKELGMTFNDYYMVLTDFDMKVKQEYEVPIAMKAVFDYIDTFTSRFKEMEHQKKQGLTCKSEDKSKSLENFLSRFRWRRRLFVISVPDDGGWAFEQQLYTLTSQACNLGLRHMCVLKLIGKSIDDMGGVLELFSINGSAKVEREDLSASLVKDIRNYFQISPDYFSMLLVGKDGNVKSWYPSPIYSMSVMYDLVDSMQLRRQEMAIQQSLGMRCPEDEYDHHGYHDRDQEGYYYRGYGY